MVGGGLTLAGRLGEVFGRESEETTDNCGDGDCGGRSMALGAVCGCCEIGPG